MAKASAYDFDLGGPQRAGGRKNARPPAPSAAKDDGVEETLWGLADEALALAWREAIVLDGLVERVSRRAGTLKSAHEGVQAHAVLVLQALGRAAALRGLRTRWAPGARAPFDPRRHDAEPSVAEIGALVRIRAPCVESGCVGELPKGAGDDPAPPTRVLVKALVSPVRVRR